MSNKYLIVLYVDGEALQEEVGSKATPQEVAEWILEDMPLEHQDLIQARVWYSLPADSIYENLPRGEGNYP